MTLRSVRPFEPRKGPTRNPAALWAFLWLVTGQVSAQAVEPLELEWSAPQGCPDAKSIKARVQALAGSAELTGSPLRVEGTIVQKRDGPFHLRLVVHVDHLRGTREIDGRSCDDLAGAAAVALALLLRSTEPLTGDDLAGHMTRKSELGRGEQSPDDSTESSRAQSEGAVPLAAPSTPLVAHNERAQALPERRWQGLLQVPLLAAGLGPLRKPSFGVAIAAGAAVRRWRFLADAEAWLPQHTTVVQESQRYGARILRFAAGLRACRAFAGPRVQVAPCASLSVEHLSARGKGPYIAASEARATWVAAGIGVQTMFNVTSWLQVVGGIDLRFHTSLPKIAIEGVGTIERLLPVAGTVRLGAEWIL
jgi:hypothetical protein